MPVPYGSMLHIPPTNSLLLAAKHEPYKKAHLLMKNIEEFSGKSSGEWAGRQKTNNTERVTGLGMKKKSRDSEVESNSRRGGET